MSTFNKLKLRLEKEGVNLSQGSITKVIKKGCDTFDDSKNTIKAIISEIVEEVEHQNAPIKNTNTDEKLLEKLRIKYEERNPDGSPKWSIFLHLNRKVRGSFYNWWLMSTGQNIAEMPRSPEFYIYHHSKDAVYIVIAEFLKDKKYVEEAEKVL